MANKVHCFARDPEQKVKEYWFLCPGCRYSHNFTVGPPDDENFIKARWTFNGSLEHPTFAPSLLCAENIPESRCHSFVTDGKIRFLDDCWHDLKNQTVELPDWEE